MARRERGPEAGGGPCFAGLRPRMTPRCFAA